MWDVPFLRRRARPVPPELAVTYPEVDLQTPSRNSSGTPSVPWVVLVEKRLATAHLETDEETALHIEMHPDVYFCSTNIHHAPTMDVTRIHGFCRYLRRKEKTWAPAERLLVYYYQRRNAAQAATLLGAYMMFHCGLSADEAERRLRAAEHDLGGLRDTLRGLQRAVALRLWDPARFSPAAHLRVAAGPFPKATLMWRKFVVLPSPVSHRTQCCEFLRSAGTEVLVRLTDASDYDSASLARRGIRVHTLPMGRDALPSTWIVREFLNICDSHDTLGVHCWDGLGNAATMVCLWLMRHLGFTSREAVCFIRTLRPGSVKQKQELFLEQCDSARWFRNLLVMPSLLEDEPPRDLSRQSSTASSAELAFASPQDCLVV